MRQRPGLTLEQSESRWNNWGPPPIPGMTASFAAYDRALDAMLDAKDDTTQVYPEQMTLRIYIAQAIDAAYLAGAMSRGL